MSEIINESRLDEIINRFSRRLIDKYTYNLEKVKMIDIIDTESNTDSEEQSKVETISYKAVITINLEKLAKDLQKKDRISELINEFNDSFNFTDKQKKDAFTRIELRMKQVYSKIIKMKTSFSIDVSENLSSIKNMITKELSTIILNSGILNQLRYSVDRVLPYKTIFKQLIYLVLLILLVFFGYKLYNRFNGSELDGNVLSLYN